MTATAFAAAATIAMTATRGGAAVDPTARVLTRVQRAEDAVRDVRVRFSQVTTIKATAESQTLTGDLALRRSPERFRVAFASPVEQVSVFDGEFLWLYLPGSAQAFRQSANPDDLSRLLGINLAAPARSFRGAFTASLTGCDGTGCHVEFVRDGAPPLAWRVLVSATDWRMREAVFENEEVRVVLSCYDYRVNRGVPDELFQMSLPKDVEIGDGIPMLAAPGAP